MANAHNTLTELFTDTANAIRSKTGSASPIKADDFPSAISSISVGVEGGIVPTGTKEIVANGKQNIATYEFVNVNVPVGITPSGSLNITENGSYDVTSKASAVVNVPQLCAVRTFTLSSDLGAAEPFQFNQTVITGDAFIKAHYNNSTLSMTLVPQTPFAADAGVVQFIHQSNSSIHKIGSNSYYGICSLSQGASNSTLLALSTNQPLTSRTYIGGGFVVNSSGNVNLCGGNSVTTKPRIIKAGTYFLIMTCRS